MEGAELGGRALDVLPVLTGSAPAPPLEDPVSVYNIYMYVLFLVLYGPCPLSGRPHKSSPRSLAAWFVDALEWGRGGDARRSFPNFAQDLGTILMLVQFSDPSQLACYHSSVFLSSLDGVFLF